MRPDKLNAYASHPCVGAVPRPPRAARRFLRRLLLSQLGLARLTVCLLVLWCLTSVVAFGQAAGPSSISANDTATKSLMTAAPTQKVAAAQTSTAESTATKTQGPRKGPNEGITVHGWWTIEVRNPEGKVVTHREFENALSVQGANILTNFLLNLWTPGIWNVSLGGTSTQANPCGAVYYYLDSNNNFQVGFAGAVSPLGGPGACQLLEQSTAPICSETGIFCNTLTRIPPLGTLPANGVTGFSLQGTFTVPQSAPTNSVIGSVQTALGYCIPTSGSGLSDISPSTCNATNNNNTPLATYPFTVGQVNPPVPVQPNQTVSVTVQFSFQ